MKHTEYMIKTQNNYQIEVEKNKHSTNIVIQDVIKGYTIDLELSREQSQKLSEALSINNTELKIEVENYFKSIMEKDNYPKPFNIHVDLNEKFITIFPGHFSFSLQHLQGLSHILAVNDLHYLCEINGNKKSTTFTWE